MKKVLSIVTSLLVGFTVPVSLLGIVVIVAGTVLLTSNVIRKNPEVLGLLKGPEILKQEEREFVAKVGKSIALPSDEDPTVVTVSELDKLTNQPFFSSAQKDDKVLIYTNAKKVILYRPSEERVVEVGSINIQSQKNGEVSGEMTKVQPFKVVLLNGTEVTGLTQKVEDKLKKDLVEAEVVSKANAVKFDYEKTLVVDLSGQKANETKLLAEKLGVEVGQMPEGESKPEGVDVLVIVGKDQDISNL